MGFPFPGLNAAALIAVETIGGLALLAGAFTRAAGAFLAFAMLIAVAAVHLPNGYFLPNGVEFALTLLLGSLALTQTGPGRYSVDVMTQRRATIEELPVRKAA
jgi:putative oxidoreductase